MTPTRAPTARRTYDVRSLVGQLNLEWADLQTSTDDVVRRWGIDEPVLAHTSSLAQLEAMVRAHRSPADDDILLALLRLGRRGDHLAHRAVLQMLLGKLVHIARTQTARFDGLDDALAAVIEAAWRTITRYPHRVRVRKVRNNLVLDTLNRVVRSQHRPPPTVSIYAPARADDGPHATSDAASGRLAAQGHFTVDPARSVTQLGGRSPDEHANTAREEMLDLLDWARESSVLSAAETQLLACYYNDQTKLSDLAAQMSVSREALGRRASRAVGKLAASAAAYPDGL